LAGARRRTGLGRCTASTGNRFDAGSPRQFRNRIDPIWKKKTLGDVAVGLAAPFAAIAVALKAPGWQRAANGVIVAGLADFAVAVVTGIGSIGGNFLDFAAVSSEAVLNALPVSLIPNFLVPVFIILHVMAIIKIRSMR
jgi:hypothetical protein